MESILIKKCFFFSLLLIALFGGMSPVKAQTVVNHNIGTGGDLIIHGTSTSHYVVTGTTSVNHIIVGRGYHGKITLNGVTMTSTAAKAYTTAQTGGNLALTTGSPIAIQGQNSQSNRAPLTVVDIVLQGTSSIINGVNYYCGIQVDQGAQVQFSAIDPNNNASGVLTVRASSSNTSTAGGAGIGGLCNGATNVLQGTAPILNGGSITSGNTGGGNVMISSGTITARGAHGAGIGGGFMTYYNGVIIVYGGIVNSSTNYHAAGIGSGCPRGTGVVAEYPADGAVIALPPAQITGYGATTVGTNVPSLTLAGTARVTYINDPNRKLITVRTSDNEPNATIYLDLTQTTGLVALFNQLGIVYDLAKVKIGTTNAAGNHEFHAELQQTTTFFTDASSTKPTTLGRPYLPVDTIITGNAPATATVILPLLPTNISLEDIPSTPLEVGYSVPDALSHAYRLKVTYSDSYQMTGVTWQIQGNPTDFTGLLFYAADGVTQVAQPTTLSAGDVYYVAVPIKPGYPAGRYSDVILIRGYFQAVLLPGYIRRISDQLVVFDDSNTNTYINVRANPVQFKVNSAAAGSTKLTLQIDTAFGDPYVQAEIVAKYLITTEPNYALALAAVPLINWTNMTVPATKLTWAETNVLFVGKPRGTYYIHWYVLSGVTYAHSLNVVGPPPALNGAFGPYIINGPNDDYAWTTTGKAVTVDVLANDSLGSCTRSTIVPAIVTQGAHGTAAFQADKNLRYTPLASYSAGIDSVTYSIQCGADISSAKLYLLINHPLALSYYACSGASVVMGFTPITGVSYR